MWMADWEVNVKHSESTRKVSEKIKTPAAETSLRDSTDWLLISQGSTVTSHSNFSGNPLKKLCLIDGSRGEHLLRDKDRSKPDCTLHVFSATKRWCLMQMFGETPGSFIMQWEQRCSVYYYPVWLSMTMSESRARLDALNHVRGN